MNVEELNWGVQIGLWLDLEMSAALVNFLLSLHPKKIYLQYTTGRQDSSWFQFLFPKNSFDSRQNQYWMEREYVPLNLVKGLWLAWVCRADGHPLHWVRDCPANSTYLWSWMVVTVHICLIGDNYAVHDHMSATNQLVKRGKNVLIRVSYPVTSLPCWWVCPRPANGWKRTLLEHLV